MNAVHKYRHEQYTHKGAKIKKQIKQLIGGDLVQDFGIGSFRNISMLRIDFSGAFGDLFICQKEIFDG